MPNSNLATVNLLNLVWIGRRVSNAAEARIWSYTFSEYLSA